jgi:hypothetical protein
MQIDNITLPDYRMAWVDKLQHSSIVQESEYAMNGALLVERGTKLAGLPITLESGQDSGFTRDLLEQLVVHANTKTTEFTITLTDGSTHTVIWDIQDNGSHIEGLPQFRNDNEPADQKFVNIKLRFITYVA